METKKGSPYFSANYVTLKQLHDQRLKEKQEAEDRLRAAAAAAEERRRSQHKEGDEKLRRSGRPKNPHDHRRPKTAAAPGPALPADEEAKHPDGGAPDRDVEGNPNAVRGGREGKGEISSHEAKGKEGADGEGDLHDPWEMRRRKKRKGKIYSGKNKNGGALEKEEDRKPEEVLDPKQESGLGAIDPEPLPVKPARRRGGSRRGFRSNGDRHPGARIPRGEPHQAVELVGQLEDLTVSGGDEIGTETGEGKVERGRRWIARMDIGRNPRVLDSKQECGLGTIDPEPLPVKPAGGRGESRRGFRSNGERHPGARAPRGEPQQAVELVGRLDDLTVSGGDEIGTETGEGKAERGRRWTARVGSERNPRVRGFGGVSHRHWGRSGAAPDGMVWVRKNNVTSIGSTK